MYVFVNIEKAFDKVPKKRVGVSDEEKRFTRSNCKSSEESVTRIKDEN